jgi:hypothetical protein
MFGSRDLSLGELCNALCHNKFGTDSQTIVMTGSSGLGVFVWPSDLREDNRSRHSQDRSDSALRVGVMASGRGDHHQRYRADEHRAGSASNTAPFDSSPLPRFSIETIGAHRQHSVAQAGGGGSSWTNSLAAMSSPWAILRMLCSVRFRRPRSTCPR